MLTAMETKPKSTALVVPENGTLTTTTGDQVVPAIVAAAGDKAARRYLEFFAVTIENAEHPRGVFPRLPAVLRLVRGQRHR